MSYNLNPTPPYRIGSTASTTTNGAISETEADLAEALRLLDLFTPVPENCYGPDCCIDSRAHALLVRHGIREALWPSRSR